MEKKTKLITIDYEEYLRLCLSDRERTIKMCKNLIKVIGDYRNNFKPNKDVDILLNNLVSYLQTRIFDNEVGDSNNSN